MNNRLLSNILFVVRAIDGARGPVDLGFARTVSRHPVDVGFETTETKCRREAETLELRAPDGAKEAIDGRRAERSGDKKPQRGGVAPLRSYNKKGYPFGYPFSLLER